MPLPVIANVFRIEMDWHNTNGFPAVRNVLNVRCTSSGSEEDVANAFNDANAGLTQDPWDAMADDYVCQNIIVTKLDGSSAGFPFTMTNIPQGGSTGQKIMQAAAVVSIHTAARGSRGRGRQYVGPITESTQNGGVLESTNKSNMLVGWGELFAGMLISSPSIEPGVASYVHADFHPMTTFRIDDLIGTQRRRLDALR